MMVNYPYLESVNCHFCSYNIIVENEAHFVLDFPYTTPLEIKLKSSFENAISSSLKSFFQLDHQVDISCLSHRGYCTLLSYSKDVVVLTPS